MKILVCAASKHGATQEIAETIQSGLAGRGFEVTLLPASDVQSVDGFDAAVIGSAVYAGHWMGEAKDVIDNNAPGLASMPVWLFSSGPIGDPPKPEEDPVDVAPILEAVSARGHRLFSGALDKSKLGFGEKAIVTALRAPSGDFRDWKEIEAWAGEIADELRASDETTA